MRSDVTGRSVDLEQHAREISANLDAWNNKPLLRRVYGDLYGRMRNHLRRDIGGAVVEIGSGIGHIKTFIPECVTTDLFDNPGIDRVESVYRLSFADGSVENILMLHIFHHLRYPGTAFEEMRRVLVPGGRVIILDPYISLLGRLVYGPLHHEPVGMGERIECFAPEGFTPDDDEYYAAQGNATRVFVRGECPDLMAGWRLRAVERFSALSYVLAGGYSKPQLYPTGFYRMIRGIERVFDLVPAVFGTCLLVVLEKVGVVSGERC